MGSMMFALNTILLSMLVSRISGVIAAGEFTIAFTTSQILYMVGLYGMQTFQRTDYIHQYNFEDYFAVKLVTSFFMSLIFILFITISNFTITKILLTGLLTIFMLINSYAEVYQSLLFQENRLDLSGRVLFFRTFASFLSFLITFLKFRNIFLALIIMIFVNLAVTYFIAVKTTKKFIYKNKNQKTNKNKVIRLLLDCTPLFLSSFLSVFMFNSSKYAIEYMLNDEIQGYFNVIFMPAMVINTISGFLFFPMLNKFSLYLEKKQFNNFFSCLKKQMLMILGLTICCMIGVLLFGIPILEILYGIDISELKNELILIIIGGGFFAVSMLLFYILVILRKQNLILINYMLIAIFALIFSLVLVKKYGILGASISFLVSHLVLALSYIIVLFIQLNRKKLTKF